MKIPFDIKHRDKIESGEYQVMSGDKKARIICWDARGSESKHIVALVGDDGQAENIQRYYENGELISDSARRHTKDLYILTSKDDQFTKFEELLNRFSKDVKYRDVPYTELRAWAGELLELAEKELMGDYKYQYVYAKGFEAGKAVNTINYTPDSVLRDGVVTTDRALNEYEARLYNAISALTVMRPKTIKQFVIALAPDFLSEAGREIDRMNYENLPKWEKCGERPKTGYSTVYCANIDGYLYGDGKRIKLADLSRLQVKDEPERT